MSTEAMDKFEQVVYDGDHQEAMAIDRAYDRLARFSKSGGPELVTRAAAKVERRLSKTIPGAEVLGHETLKQARRWWMYRNSYLQQLLPVYRELDASGQHDQHGLDPIFDSYIGKLDYLTERQQFAGERLSRGSQIYGQTYAALEQERVRQSRHGQELLDPLALEEQYAFGALKTGLELMLEDKNAVEYANTRYHRPANRGNASDYFSIMRSFGSGYTSYTFDHYQTGGPGAIAKDGLLMPSEVYRLSQNLASDSLQASGETKNGSVLLDATLALELAERLAKK